MLDLGQYQIRGSTAREIAGTAEAAIREGLLQSGQALPTVRELAKSLGVSPATVNSAYRILQRRSLVIAEGRRGTRVAARPAVRMPAPSSPRARGLGTIGGAEPWQQPRPPAGVRDLTIGLPDAELLPSVSAVVAKLDLASRMRFSQLEGIDPKLLEVAGRWFADDGLDAPAIAVVSGAFDGIERVLQAHLRPGDRVVIEDPTYPSIRDVLLGLGLVGVPVKTDERGLLPEALAAALHTGAEGIVIVPRAQNPLGAALDDERAAALRAVLERAPEVLIVEDDHAWSVSGAPFATLVSPQRARWSVVRSVSKILHPDLRVALVAGDRTTIARVEGRQSLGPRWVSHVLQAIVAEMMRDSDFIPTCERAAEVYGARRRALIEALADRGVRAYGRSGLNVWVAVREEAPVVRSLLAAGWLVLAGEPFRIRTPAGVRITISTLLEEEANEVAELIAQVETAARPRRVY